MPTTAQATWTYNIVTPVVPRLSATDAFILGPSQVLAAGTLVAQKTADSKLYAYASGASDGTQNPIGVVEFDCSSDASGNMFMGLTASSEFGNSELSVPVFFTGVFNLSDLTNYNAGTPIAATTTDILKIAGAKVVNLGTTAAGDKVQF